MLESFAYGQKKEASETDASLLLNWVNCAAEGSGLPEVVEEGSSVAEAECREALGPVSLAGEGLCWGVRGVPAARR